MPQRTNRFQELVAMIAHVVSGPNVQISESKMIDSPIIEREVDVLIDDPFGVYRLTVLEAKDEKRRLDITTVEGIWAKYIGRGGARVDKLVIVSSSGFTEAAIARGILDGFETLTLEEAFNVAWSDFRELNLLRGPTIVAASLDPKPFWEGDVFHPGRPNKTTVIDDAGKTSCSFELFCNEYLKLWIELKDPDYVFELASQKNPARLSAKDATYCFGEVHMPMAPHYSFVRDGNTFKASKLTLYLFVRKNTAPLRKISNLNLSGTRFGSKENFQLYAVELLGKQRQVLISPSRRKFTLKSSLLSLKKASKPKRRKKR
ncbi:MAG: hypothetical protein SGI77_11530 [Pirellulaceae bacterium]|nr:hypothetical protein [Pirellulaceae bacterium]